MNKQRVLNEEEMNDALRLIRNANKVGIGVSLYEDELSLYWSSGLDNERYRSCVVPILRYEAKVVEFLRELDIENEKLVWWFICHGQKLVPKRPFSMFGFQIDDPEQFKKDLLSKIYEDAKSYKENSGVVAYQIRCFKRGIKNGELYVQHPQIRSDDSIQVECRILKSKEVVDAMCAGIDPREKAEFEDHWYADA